MQAPYSIEPTWAGYVNVPQTVPTGQLPLGGMHHLAQIFRLSTVTQPCPGLHWLLDAQLSSWPLVPAPVQNVNQLGGSPKAPSSHFMSGFSKQPVSVTGSQFWVHRLAAPFETWW